jgi:photosystem II stability/assembly factor-like uncharacterized protein
MKKLLLLISGVFIFSTSQAQWITQTFTTNNLYSVFAIDPNAVCATGYTGPIRTLNGGTTWSQNIILGGTNTYEVHTKNPLKWYVLCQNSNWFLKVGNPSGVSLQGGKPDSILSLNWRDMACAVAVGTNGKIETTCDTGATWQLKSSGTTANLNAIWFSDKDSACAVGANGVIKRTKDGGMTWNNINSGLSTALNGIHFPDASVGYICGAAGKLLKTMDAGQTWTNMPTGVLNTLNGVFFIDADTGYVVGTAGLIMKTINGGVNWNTMMSGTSQVLNSVHFATQVDGWAVGNAGTILKYNGSAGLGVAANSEEKYFKFYPNPAKDFVTLISQRSLATIKLYNALGQVVYSGLLESEETKIDIRDLKPGVYFAEWNADEVVVTRKFIKE